MSTGSEISTDNETCSQYYNLSLGDDPYNFRSTTIIERLHKDAIRFGKTSDIGVLYRNDTTRSEKQEYVVGVSTTSIIIFMFITTWFALILMCMCLGPDRVGFFSGRRTKAEQRSKITHDKNGRNSALLEGGEEDDDDNVLNDQNDNGIADSALIEQETADVFNEDSDGVVVPQDLNDVKNDGDEQVVKQQTEQDQNLKRSSRMSFDSIQPKNTLATSYRTRLVRARVVVLMCSLGVVICVILFITFGVQNLLQSSKNVVAGVEEGRELAIEAITLVDHFLMRQKMALEVLTPFVMEVNGICPNVTEAICANITDSTTCDFTDIPLSEEFQDAFTFVIDNVEDATLDKADSLRMDLMELDEELGKVADKIASFNWAFAVAAVFAIALLIANLVISHGIIVAWRRETVPPKYECCSKVLGLARHWLMVPIFVFLVVMSWIFSMVFIIGSIAAADLCYGSPDDTVLAILKKDVLPLDSMVRDLLIFYVEGCPDYGVPDDLTNKVNEILNYADQVANVANGISNDEFVENFVATCGNDTSVLDAAAVAVQGTICNVGATLAEVVLFFSCPNWSTYFGITVCP